MKKRVLLFLVAASAILIGLFLNTGHFVPILLGSALVDSMNPCAFSVLFLTMTFLFGLGRERVDIVKAGGLYIFGIFLTYVLVGLGVLGALSLFGIPDFLSKIVAFVLVAFGAIEIMDGVFPKFPVKLKMPASTHTVIARFIERGSLAASFVLGILVGLFEFPCVGGPYLFVLGLLHDHATYLAGFGYLVLYNLVFILPLAVVLAVASNREFLAKVETLKKENGRLTKIVVGILMIALAAVIIFF